MKKETISAGQVYVDLLNRIKKINGDVGPEIEEIERTLSLILTCIPSGASSDNKLVTEEELPAAQVNSDWNAVSGVAQILNKPTIPAAQVNSDWNATSGVAEILNKPTIPAAQVNSDWNAVSGVAQILNKPTIHNPIQFELYVTTGGWTYSSLDKYYKKTFTLPTPLNGDYSPTISNNQYTAGPAYNWIRTICGGSLSSDGTTLELRARQEPPENNIQVFIQGWS